MARCRFRINGDAAGEMPFRLRRADGSPMRCTPAQRTRIVTVLVLFWAGLVTVWSQSVSQLTIDSPATGRALGRIEGYLQTESALSPRVRALSPLITAREMNLPYEWSLREDAALKSGLEVAVIDVVRHNRPANTLFGDDALIIDFGRQLFRNRHVDARTFAALVERQD